MTVLDAPGSVRQQPVPTPVPVVVVGAGQAGLSASYHLRRHGVEHVVLDGQDAPGGAWRHRWPTLVMGTVNGVHDLPGQPLGDVDPGAQAAVVVPAYFADYERRWELPVLRPAAVRAVTRGTGEWDGRLLVHVAGHREQVWAAQAVLNASGTWTRPFWPAYPGRTSFTGRQVHTADYRGPAEFLGRRVVVIGGGVSAVQLLLEVAEVADTTWLTRRPPVILDRPFDAEVGRQVVASVAQRVEAGLPPLSVSAATGLSWTPALRAAAEAGVLVRWPVMDRIVADGVAWEEPVGPGGSTHLAADVLLWCTGFRAALDHLAPLHLRGPGGGIRVRGSRVVAEPQVWLLGYGPSASTVGATRAAHAAVLEVRAMLAGSAVPGDAQS